MKLEDMDSDLMARMVGLLPPADFESDGATGALDELLAIDSRPAALLHDWHYELGITPAQRKKADRLLYRNLRSLDVGKIRAMWWYVAVRIFGWRHFNYARPADRRRECLRSVLVSVCLAAAVAAIGWWAWG
jgi:hypothetical protein